MLGLFVLIIVVAAVFPREILTVDSGRVRGDYIVLVGGGSGERAPRAAELFLEGAAPKVIITGKGDCGSNRRVLIRRGVPAEVIEVEPESRNTRENAMYTVGKLRAIMRETGTPGISSAGESRGKKPRVLIVTSWYHSRRALCSFQHYAPEIQFYSRPAYFGYPRSEWKLHGMRKYMRLEYVKLIGYCLRYGIWPL